MIKLTRPLVLVHGLWDTPDLFRPLIRKLNESKARDKFAPYLRHSLGKRPLFDLANELDKQINLRFGSDISIDILGFSMGGLISRIWLQDFGGIYRTSRFFSVGSPQQGTLTAQLMPTFFLRGISDMKIGSKLLSRLNRQKAMLHSIECISLYTKWDLMVFPFWNAKLPYGKSMPLPVLTHKALIRNPKSIDFLINELLSS